MLENDMGFIRLTDTPQARIMVRAANWVGDAIMTTPVIRAVRRNFPKAQVTVVAKPWVIPVYANNPFVDHVWEYDTNGRHKRGMGTFRLAGDLRREGFHLAILMQNAFEAALISFLAGIPERLGYTTDGRGLLLNRGIKMNPALKKGHLIDYYLSILKKAGLSADGRQMDLFLSPADQSHARQFLDQAGLTEQFPVIGINPGATGGTAKRWFPQRYARLCRKLSSAFGVRILIFGGPADAELGEEIAEAAGGCCLNIAGKTSLGQAFALIEKCSLFVTNDSGLMHAAAALNTPQVALIGSTDHVATAPSSRAATMIRVPVHCSPCLKDVCPDDHACMDRISVDMVFEKCREILAENTFLRG